MGEREVSASHIEILEPVVLPVRHTYERFPAAGVDLDPVGLVHLSLPGALPRERTQITAVFRVHVDPRLAVSVGDVDLPGRRYGGFGGYELIGRAVDLRKVRGRHPHDLPAVERRFCHEVEGSSGEVQVLDAIFHAQEHAVSPRRVLVAPSPEVLAVRGKGHDRRFPCVVDVYCPVTALAHRVGGSELDSVRQPGPVGCDYVPVASRSDFHVSLRDRIS